MSNVFAGIDIGSTAFKVALVDQAGTLTGVKAAKGQRNACFSLAPSRLGESYQINIFKRKDK
ncbi:MAG TPA: hypothetical protein VGB35_05665 [Gammaproteobacteria bacterium]|jgi:activator of 2-hydroxyglutaryl-CoA dehydratase